MKVKRGGRNLRFVVATQDYSGLGFAVRLRDEGHDTILATNPPSDCIADPHRREAYERVGTGMVEKSGLEALISRRETLRDWYWIWDYNHSVTENEMLRREGFKVLGGGEYADRMEHDRQACLDFAATYGLAAPPSRRFSDAGQALEFLQRNPRTAYVYKPDEGDKFETFIPESEDAEDANAELRVHLTSARNDRTFILQERKDGVETDVEVWFQRGDPVFAFMTLECKRKYALDLGELSGCAFDFTFAIPLASKAVSESVGKLFPAYKRMNYTGFGDANFIAARDGVWFFEKCERFGYNAHPNLLFNLSRNGVGEPLAALIDGSFHPGIFSGGFGASVTMNTKENAPGGKAVQFPAKVRNSIFFWDVYKEGELYLTAGYDKDGYVLIVNGYGYTMPTAWENAMKKAASVKFPYRHYRPDGDRTDFPSSPVRRYEALRAMGYI